MSSTFALSRSCILALALSQASGLEPVRGQQVASAQPAERGTDLLTVSFAAVEAAGGGLVPDLRGEEVTVKIDGRSRPIRSLQLVSRPQRDGRSALPLPPPFGSNNVSGVGRHLELIVDDESFVAGGEQPLRDAVTRLTAGLHPLDRLSLISIPHGGVRIPATTDHGRVRTAIATLVGRGESGQTGSDLACRSRDTLQALTSHLSSIRPPESPTVVAFMTAGLAPPRRDANIMLAPGRCELLLDTFREAGAAAGRARAQFYVIPPVAIVAVGSVQRENIAGAGSTGSDNPVEGIEQLIGVTGGKLLNLGGGESGAFDRILAESTGYYVATIEPQRSDRGRSHALDVSVARRGVEVRSSRAVTFPEPDPRGPRPASPSPRDMLSTTAEFRDLPLRTAGYTSFEEAGGQIRVLTLAEPIEPGVRLAALMAAAFDRDGKGAGSWSAQPADLERAPVIGAIAVPPGAYRLRVAAIDTTGRAGAADYDLDVDLARSGPLKISSVIFGLSRGGLFVPRLQFSTEPVVIGYVEMSGAAPGAKVSAILELADAPNTVARLSVPLAIEAGAGGRYTAKGALPIGALDPGDYIVRAIIALDDHPATRVIRTLRKALPPK
jgi:hypothetical protein